MPRKHRSKVRPDINVTPLVDIVLVLLIIFMVVVPQMEAGAHVELAAAKNVDPDDEKKLSALVISITTDGDLYFERDQIDAAGLLAHLKASHEEDASGRVQVRVDKRTRYADVRGVFDIVQKAGYGGATLIVGDVPGAPGAEGKK